MTDPLRSDPAALAADVTERDRDARVEELLLSGLDHYFNGQHDLAINIWTRVLFLDRGHARARAYIERARGAVSERQREGEELIHAGAAAFQRGDGDAARTLLASALERGAPSEDALSLLGRLDRVQAAGVPLENRPERQNRVYSAEGIGRSARGPGRSRLIWAGVGAALGVAGAILLTLLWTQGEFWLPIRTAVPVVVVEGSRERVPVPAASEVWIARARGLFEKGRLREALAALDEVPRGDPHRLTADELRATIQRSLLDLARGTVAPRAPAPPTPPGGER